MSVEEVIDTDREQNSGDEERKVPGYKLEYFDYDKIGEFLRVAKTVKMNIL